VHRNIAVPGAPQQEAGSASKVAPAAKNWQSSFTLEEEMWMSDANTDVIRAAYDAFGRGDTPAIVGLLSDDVDWRFVGPKRLAYSGRFKKAQVMQWFADIAAVDDIQAFEPREFMSGGEHVTVLGWERCIARPSGKAFETEWVHIFTVKHGRITRFWGMYDNEASAAAR
jgi:ketosteroid isomerase-like protein